MDKNEYMETEARIIEVLRSVYDPEIPVNIYDLGLVYEIKMDKDNTANITMTLTAPNCPMADMIVEEVKYKVAGTKGVKDCNLTLTFDPPWDRDMMTDEAKLELGML
ncbi:MAG TPA: iron-sulfur cluster assembly protein [Bacteroidales bacterium]|nr:iron-sulfur cluster assembly protein [Bacteroidales bacterium]